MKKIKTGIIGASSLVSGRLIELLLNHPGIDITCLVSDYFTSKKIKEAHPHLKGISELEFEPYNLERLAAECDLVFSAKPHGQSMEKIPEILDKGIRVIDISADFRLRDAEIFKSWYDLKHTSTDLLKTAVYGLPELYFSEIKTADLVANPGCYPTSVILGLAPLAEMSLLAGGCENVIVNSISGISGAGRGLSNGNLFLNVNSNIRPYKVGTHRHTPEMEQELSRLNGVDVKVLFTPNVGPFNVGIASNIFLKLKDAGISEEQLCRQYREFYEGKPFVRVCEQGGIPEIRDVAGTNFCDMGICVNRRLKQCVIFSVIDNLIKGAAGQAVQNMNIMLGFNEREGLPYGQALKKRDVCS